MPPQQIGSYRIVKLLGEGGMGAVYEAIQEPIGRRVALKVLLPQYAQNTEMLKRFFNEARAVNLIEHPSIVQVSDYGQLPDGTAYLVMECLRGETLSARLERLHSRNVRSPVGLVVQIASQIADALAAAHEKGIVHRDLKPGNVMLVRDPAVPGGERAKILDFGIAKLSEISAKGTAAHAIMGTPQYMSPEQVRGAGGVDDKTDVYALGIIFYEMLAGRAPFVAETALEYMGQHAFQEPPPLQQFVSGLPIGVPELVHRLLTKDKSARPKMAEVSTTLTELLSHMSGMGPMPPPPSRDSNSDVTRQISLLTPPPSTLGSSSGQTLGQPAEVRKLRLVALAAVVALLATASAALYRERMRPHAASTNSDTPVKTPPTPAAPTPAATETQPTRAPAAAQTPPLRPATVEHATTATTEIKVGSAPAADHAASANRPTQNPAAKSGSGVKSPASVPAKDGKSTKPKAPTNSPASPPIKSSADYEN